MFFEQTPLPGAWLIIPELRADERGFFARTWDETELTSRSLPTRIAQSSVSFNIRRGTLRGMHYQAKPHEENKYVRCTRGSIHDVVIDLRPDSESFRAYFAITLSSVNRVTLVIPPGCAHGFLSLESESEVFYEITEPYIPSASRGVRWNDPAFAINWPFAPVIISAKDNSFEDFSP